jgi:hypothetical protein
VICTAASVVKAVQGIENLQGERASSLYIVGGLLVADGIMRNLKLKLLIFAVCVGYLWYGNLRLSVFVDY